MCAVAKLRKMLTVKSEAVQLFLKARYIRGINTKLIGDAVYTWQRLGFLYMVRCWVDLHTSAMHAGMHTGLHLKFSLYAFARISQIKMAQNCIINSPNIKFSNLRSAVLELWGTQNRTFPDKYFKQHIIFCSPGEKNVWGLKKVISITYFNMR